MSWLSRKAPNVATDDGLSPKPRRWPAIVGVTAAAWVLLSGMLLMLLGQGQ